MVTLNSGLERVSQMDILGKSLPRRLASKCKGPEEKWQVQGTARRPIWLKQSKPGGEWMMAEEAREVMGERVKNSDPVGLVGRCEDLELCRGAAI